MGFFSDVCSKGRKDQRIEGIGDGGVTRQDYRTSGAGH